MRTKAAIAPVVFISLILQACASAPPTPTSDTTAAIPTAVVRAPLPPPAITLPPINTEETVTKIVNLPPPQPLFADLWERMRARFSLHAIDHPRIRARLDWYSKHPEHLARVVERAGPYLHLIVNELEQRGLPTDLALVPAVESAYQPLALSPKNAAGLWQFIPGTGRIYGLKQNWWYDGRRDVLASTRAACDYLEKLRAEFNDDWLLVLAAYNAGEGAVHRAIEKNQRAGRPTDFWNLPLPAETRDYVPRVLALSAVVADPQSHGINLGNLADEPRLIHVDVGSQFDLTLAAELSGLTLEDLYRLNPGYNRISSDPEGPHHLLLPIDREADFLGKFAQLAPEMRTRCTRYRVAQGDTLNAIAKRFDTNASLLRKLNDLHGNKPALGTEIIVPVAMHSLDHAYTKVASSTSKKRPVRAEIITVKRGESLGSIAKRTGMTTRQLADLNGLNPRAKLKIGQRLSVRASAVTRTVHYTVRRGDTLSQISQRFKVRVADLRKWNDLPNRHTLQPGQNLKVYRAAAAG